MLTLVSVKNVEEAKLCSDLVDIVDVKNPSEGALGANFIWVIKEVSDVVDGFVSATVGDLNKAGLASLASYAIADFVDFVKVGVLANGGKAGEIVKAVVRSVDGRSKVIAVGYADYESVKSISPFELVEVARSCDADGVMIDTFLKRWPSIEILGVEGIKEFVERGRDYGLMVALAGGIKWEHLKHVRLLNPDVVGVRGLVCDGIREGSIRRDLVERFVKEVRSSRPY